MISVPQALLDIASDDRWVVWAWQNRNGTLTKPPLMVKNGRPCGYAHNNDPNTWVSLQSAQEASKHANGIGLQLLGLSGVAAIDLDNVRDSDGKLCDWAADLIERSASYSEFTPSGKGARIIGRVSNSHPTIHTKKNHPSGGHFELYVNLTEGHGRYITVTGSSIDGVPDELSDISEIITELMSLNGDATKTQELGDMQMPKSFRSNRSETDVPSWVMSYLEGNGTGDNSADFQSIINSLRYRGWTYETALELLQSYPDGPAKKYAGRLELEFNRSWSKAKACNSSPGQIIQHDDDWPLPDADVVWPQDIVAPKLDLENTFNPKVAKWIREAAEAKGAPIDYVVFSVISVLSSIIGNTRWVSPWNGWAEPPVLWTMLIGLPSAGKSPAMDAVLKPLRDAEKPLRDAASAETAQWLEQVEIAKLADSAWKEAAKSIIREGGTPPDRPKEADPGVKPHIPRLVVNDSTVEQMGVILANQPRGILQMRDELAGWLMSMQRYKSGGNDRPFWLEAYGGRGYTFERVSRDALTIERLTIAVIGGIQQDRLKSLLFNADDDGLIARFIPIWPELAPLQRPGRWSDEGLMTRIIEKLLTLTLFTGPDDQLRPWFVGFSEEARNIMDEFRLKVRKWEAQADGLMLSFIGKLPGLSARLSLVFAYLAWAQDDGEEVFEISGPQFRRASQLVETYILPMARRAYAGAAISKDVKAARRLVQAIREQKLSSFTTSQIMRLDRSGLNTKAKLDPAINQLLEGNVIRALTEPVGPKGGRPKRVYTVNPAVFRDEP